MSRYQKRRGPDASGVLVRDRMAFGHQRLKIIDLSENGAQPMEDPELGLSMVFNGCIYNYKKLREELKGKGYRFYSTSDTEVILKAYHAWGEKCVDHFNGMFTFVIFERSTGRCFMARDRLGIKPLYYIKTPAYLRFASSLPALVKTLSSQPEIDPAAFHHYMTFHSVVPAPRTIFQNIKKLEPAMTRCFEKSGTYTERYYWQPEFDHGDEVSGSEDITVTTVLDELRKAVKRRTEADVPVGVLLSGGVDSSLITGLLAETGVEDLQTFSIGFEDSHGEEGDEFKYSDIIAEKFGTSHHRIRINSDELMSHLPDCIHSMSEPMVSHDNIGFYLLSKKVAEHVKVVQSGQGADELFGGYHWYQNMRGSSNPVKDYSKAFFDRTHKEFSEAVDDRFVDQDFSTKFVERHFSTDGAKDPVDKALRLDMSVMLVDDPVKRVDNMTMSWSLEARVPFLDHEVVECAAAINPELKLKNNGKYILKQAARRVVPDEVIDRPKGYFPVPALKYLKGQTLEYVKDALCNQTAKERGLFKPGYIKMLLSDPASHITPLQGSKLWQLATLELWLQSHSL